MHLAATGVGDRSRGHEFVRVNVDGTRALLDAARAAGVGRFVHVSSPSVAHAGQPLVGAGAAPADPAAGAGHYARSKALAELAALAADGDGFAVVAVRPHLVWGPGDTQLVARIVERARAGRLVLVDGGRRADRHDVRRQRRRRPRRRARPGRRACTGEAFVVSNGEPRTVAELVARICRRPRASPAPPRAVPDRRGSRRPAARRRAAWALLRRDDEPPMTRFLAEQLATAHWFDQRETRARAAVGPGRQPRRGLRPAGGLVRVRVRAPSSRLIMGKPLPFRPIRLDEVAIGHSTRASARTP